MKIIRRHFRDAGRVTPANAWKFLCEALLWFDASTGLAHLYESDKAQPGRSKWYERSIRFTNILRREFGGISKDALRQRFDKLFRGCLEVLEEAKAAIKAEKVEAPQGEELGEASDEAHIVDAELAAELMSILQERAGLKQERAHDLARYLTERARHYFTVERKRQNVLGEGYEDVLHHLLVEVAGVDETLLRLRKRANTLPGFQGKTERDRIEAPDLAVVVGDETKVLATVKWSLRQDRQKQLSDEVDGYIDLRSQKRFPFYTLVTNEYDPGRLVNTAGLERRGQHIDCIYHTNLDVLLEVLADHPKAAGLRALVEKGTLRSLEAFLNEMGKQFGAKKEGHDARGRRAGGMKRGH
jgi:hypothetical protein